MAQHGGFSQQNDCLEDLDKRKTRTPLLARANGSAASKRLNCQLHLHPDSHLPHLDKPGDSTTASQKEGPWKELHPPVKREEQTFGTCVSSHSSHPSAHAPAHIGGSP